MIWAVVPAAGKSERMGRPKMLLPFGRKTLIEKVVSGVMKFSIDGILVVVGAQRGEIEQLLRAYPVKSVFNPDFEQGMLSSIQKGLNELPGEAQAVLVVLGDQPQTPASVAERIIAGFEQSGKGIILPTYRGRRGHPTLIDLKYKGEIMSLDPAVGLRQLLLRHPDDILEVPVRTSSVLHDIDRPGDFRKATKRNRR
jgi:molybdenum cofactor cytidylyltransferase